jgi:hypothetical protein
MEIINSAVFETPQEMVTDASAVPAFEPISPNELKVRHLKTMMRYIRVKH